MPNFNWDENKQKINMVKHGMDFNDAWQLWNSEILIVHDDRKNYGEQRWIGTGLLKQRAMVVVFTQLEADVIRIISFRKANRREVKDYEKEITAQKTKICNIYNRTIKTDEKPN